MVIYTETMGEETTNQNKHIQGNSDGNRFRHCSIIRLRRELASDSVVREALPENSILGFRLKMRKAVMQPSGEGSSRWREKAHRQGGMSPCGWSRASEVNE